MPPPDLHYEMRQPIHRRRSLSRWLTALGFLAIAAVSLLWLPVVWRQIKLSYWQHRCMIYAYPANQNLFNSITNQSIIPQEWAAFYTLLSPPGFRSLGTIFLHERKTPKGKSVLVAIDIDGTNPFGYSASCRLILPGEGRQAPQHFRTEEINLRWRDSDPPAASHTLVVESATADPVDPTHFTITCLEDGREQTADFWLDDNYEVNFAPREARTSPHQ